MRIVRSITAVLLTLLAAGSVQGRQAPASTQHAARSTSGSLLEQPARLHVESALLNDALRELQTRSGVPLAYSPSLLPGGFRVTCACGASTVGEALDRLLEGTGFRYEELSSQVLVERKPVVVPAPVPVAEVSLASAVTVAVPEIETTTTTEASWLSRLGDRIGSLFDARAASVTGRVTDEATGQPLASVQVYLVGTTIGSLTDGNGRFLINDVPPGIYAVEAKLIGYADARAENVRVPADGTVEVNLALRVTALPLDAVIVTGVTSATSARRVPFTVARISTDQLGVPTTNALASIQGKVAGASIITPGQPGSGVNILLRTPTSINKSTAPLFVVDGVILASTFGRSSADLDALDIESIEIVKGAAAASLYGSRAANGVVQIRTKRGSGLADGQTRIRVRSEFGSNALANEIGLATHHYYLTNSAGDYVDASGAVVSRDNRVERPAETRFLDVSYRDPTYDHVDQFFDPGTFWLNSVSVAQNTAATNFFASYGNNRTDGVLLNAGAYRLQDLRLNLDHRLRDELTLSISGFHSRSNRENLDGDAFFDLVQQAPDANLLLPDEDGTKYIYQPDPEGVTINPLYNIAVRKDTEDRVRTLGNVELRWTPINFFSVNGQLSYDQSNRLQKFEWPRGKKTDVASYSAGFLSRGSGTTTALNGAVSANLLGSIGDLTTRLTARVLTERETYEFFSADAANLSVEGVPDLSAGTEPQVSESSQEIRSNAYFVTTDLDYQGKYIVNGLVRRDGSSLFGPDQRWHTYGRGSFAWRMTEEDWWPWSNIGEFKLRYSIGTAGGRPSFADQYETYSFTSGGTVVKSTLGNRDLKPELAREQEIGLDALLWDRVSVQLNYARVKTTDQLIAIPLTAAYGFSSQWQNAGTVEGNTWEGTINAQLISNENTRLSVGLIGDRSRHEITQFDRPCFRTGTDNLSYRCAGESLGVMYGYKFMRSTADLPSDAPASEFQTNDDGVLVWVGAGGNYRNEAWNTSTTYGNTTYEWGMPILFTDSTQTPIVARIGDSNPDFHVGFNGNLQWKDFSVYGLLDAQVGGDVYNRTKQRMYQYFRSSDTDQAGKPDELKKTTDYYIKYYAANLINDWFVEDASFLKLRELSIRYTVPTARIPVLASTGVDALRIGLVGRNLFTVTGYSGYDPEVGSPLLRMDDFVYPPFRTITAIVEIEF